MKTSHEELKLVIAGHVDHGKSTIIGRMLADTNSLPEGKLAAVKENCHRNSKPFEYAFLLDALKDEQSQGITIDAARIFFRTTQRNYLIIDAPGHIEFLKNMITGASWAEAALLVIDAREGVRENSRRHGYMLSFLGIQQICVLVNKMDLVGFQQKVFDKIQKEYTEFLEKLHVRPLGFIPVSGMEGDNIATHSERMPWYPGPSVLNQLDLFKTEKLPEDKPFRMPVQGIYKFTENNDNRRIVAGRIESGCIRTGDPITFYPSGKSTTVATIESFNNHGEIAERSAGWSIGFTMREQIFVKRGEIACLQNEDNPETSSRMQVRLFWLGKQPMRKEKSYIFKLGTSKMEMQIESIGSVMDASTLKTKKAKLIQRNEIAECVLRLEHLAAFDSSSKLPETSRFVVVDNYEISGGGMIVESLPDPNRWIHDQAVKRNKKWELIQISDAMRSERYNQKACMVLITGSPENGFRKEVAKQLTEKLFHEGKFVYFIGMANLLYGIDADIREVGVDVRPEHMRRLAEVGNLMMHAGLILVVSAQNISDADMRILETALTDRSDRLITVWTGNNITTDLQPDLHFSEAVLGDATLKIKELLKKEGYIFSYWGNGD